MISMPDNPEDVKDVIQKVIRSLLKMDKGPADQPSDVPVIIGDGKLASQTTSGIAALHFKNLNMMKLLKAFLAARVIYGVHQLVSLQLNNEILRGVCGGGMVMVKLRRLAPAGCCRNTISSRIAGNTHTN
jgi:hypothetical protein